MFTADQIFKRNIANILEDGVFSQLARPKYENGKPANSKYVTGVFDTYDLSKREFPITTLRPIRIKKAIGEMLWIYQEQTNDLHVLKDKYGISWWDSWAVGGGKTIGQRYGATVRKHNIIDSLLLGLEENPWNRRNIINLWQYEDFEETDGLLPCAFQTMFDVRKIHDTMYLDATLVQRSNDMLVAHHINAMQYVALQMMIAKHFGWKVGKFCYLVQNLHIYDNQFDQAHELLKRPSAPQDTNIDFYLDVPDCTHFYDIKLDDFVLENYYPSKPQIKFNLAI